MTWASLALAVAPVGRAVAAGASPKFDVQTDQLTPAHRFTLLHNARIEKLTLAGGLAAKIGAANKKIAAADIVTIRATSKPAAAAAGQWQLLLRNDDQWPGRPVGIKGQNFVFSAPGLGRLQVPLTQVLAMRRSSGLHVSRKPADHDTVFLKNGDALTGVFDTLAGSGIEFSSKLGKITIPLKRVRGLVLGGAAMRPPRKLRARVVLSSGLTLTTGYLNWPGGGTVQVKDPAGTILKIPAANIRRIRMVGGRTNFLSRLTPSKITHVFYFSAERWPVQKNSNVLGQPLRVNGRVYHHGLGVHTSTTLTYALGGKYKTLVIRPALDDSARPFGEARVSIAVDGKTVFQKTLHSEAPQNSAPPLALPLNGARTLTLSAVSAGHAGVQGRVDFLHAALVKP